MNVGQILETHLGWAAKALGLHVRDARLRRRDARRRSRSCLDARPTCPTSGKTVLYDGMTGEPFEQQVTVGYIYMLKLSPPGGRQDPRALDRTVLADHPAAAGRQGPVRRPALRRDGGVGARGLRRRLHPAGAADRQVATTSTAARKIYEAIVKGEVPAEPGLPESFNVLVRELQSLCLDVELMKTEGHLIGTRSQRTTLRRP